MAGEETVDVRQATWRYDYDEESKMYTVWWLLPGAKAALGSDWLHVADVYTEDYAKMLIADHAAREDAERYKAALEAASELGFLGHSGSCQGPYGGHCSCGFGPWFDDTWPTPSAGADTQTPRK